jgi:hypothetical protein
MHGEMKGEAMTTTDWMRHLSAHELALLGMQDLAYIKRVVIDRASGYAVHAADGTQIAVIAEREVAFATVRQHDLEPVSVH